MQVWWPHGKRSIKLQVRRQGGKNRACVRTEQTYDEKPGPVKWFTKQEIKNHQKGGK